MKDVDRAEVVASIHATLWVLSFAQGDVVTDSSYVNALWTNTVPTTWRKANPDLVALVNSIRSKIRAEGRRISYHKVYSHVKDHHDQEERLRRFNWMKDTYPTHHLNLIEGNDEADALAKNGLNGKIYVLPTFPTVTDSVYLGTKEDPIFNIRPFLRNKHYEIIKNDINNKLSCFEWNKLALVDSTRSNAIFCNKSYKLAPLAALTMRMRRKALPENARTLARCTSSSFFAGIYTIPESAKCPLCTETEEDQHVMTSCTATHHLRLEAEEKIQKLVQKRSRKFPLPPPPVWWNTDHRRIFDGEGFLMKWGSMGIIPLSLTEWVKEYMNLTSKADLDAILWEFQFIILQCSKACWGLRNNRS